MKKIILRIVGQILSITIFMVVFLGALFITYGYRYDFEENEVRQTSVIDICAIPKKADLYLDEELYSQKSCEKIFGLDLGAHTLKIEKDGYYEWTKNIYLNKQNVSLYPQVFLIPFPEYYSSTIIDDNADGFWVSPNQSKLAVYDKSLDILKIYSVSGSSPDILEVPGIVQDIIWLSDSAFVLDTNIGKYQGDIFKGDWKELIDIVIRPKTANTNLIVDGNELWIFKDGQKELITRYSEVIHSAQYFFNEFNIMVATEKDIRICDIDGENCYMVAEKDGDSAVAHPSRSKKIIFVKDGKLMQVSLNAPSGEYVEINL